GMSLTTNSSSRCLTATEIVARHGILPVATFGLLHVVAIGVMAWTETTILSKAIFLLTWGLLNFLFLALLRRPVISAAAALLFVALLIVLSEFKYQVLFMTLNFVDLMIIDPDTISFLFTIFPSLSITVGIIFLVLIPLFVLFWRLDPMRLRRPFAVLGFAACFLGMVTTSLTFGMEPFETFYGNNYVSTFSRTGVAAVTELMTHGMLEAEASVSGRLKSGAEIACTPAASRPH